MRMADRSDVDELGGFDDLPLRQCALCPLRQSPRTAHWRIIAHPEVAVMLVVVDADVAAAGIVAVVEIRLLLSGL